MGKFGKVVERGDNRKWFKTDPKPNLLTITTGPPPYTVVCCSSAALVICGRIGWVSSKVITLTISLGSSLFGALTAAI